MLRAPESRLWFLTDMGSRTSQAELKRNVAFADRLRAARTLAGFQTHKEAAAALGIEAERYRRWERAETEPSIDILEKISVVFAVSLDTLIKGRAAREPETFRVRDEEQKKISR